MLRSSSFFRLTLLLHIAGCNRSPTYDLVIQGGRVIDPETNLDGVRSIGIRGATIVEISKGELRGKRVIDATNLVVAPGFIDLHQHQQDDRAYRLKALDGVTTALEMETGVPDIAAFLEERRGSTLINYGATASQEAARVVAWEQPLAPSSMGPAAAIDDPPSGPVTDEPPTEARIQRQLEFLATQLDRGALGIGIGLEYTPGATRLEIIRIFELAARRKRPVYIHVRSAGAIEPGSSVESVGEAIAAAAVTGASVHIVHLNSSCLRFVRDCLAMVQGATDRGLDVTVEAYPYGAGMGSIASAFFNPGWRERRGIDYGAVEIPETGEHLTKARFEALHAAGKPVYVLIHMNPDSIVDFAISHPLTMIASDGLPSHPREAGTYAKVLARYVRSGRLTLIDAIRKMSLMPARRLESSTALARRKGRIQVGADADVVVFDLERVADRATFRAPAEPSVGMAYVLVMGRPVVDGGRLVAGATPGQPMVAAPSAGNDAR